MLKWSNCLAAMPFFKISFILYKDFIFLKNISLFTSSKSHLHCKILKWHLNILHRWTLSSLSASFEYSVKRLTAQILEEMSPTSIREYHFISFSFFMLNFLNEMLLIPVRLDKYLHHFHSFCLGLNFSQFSVKVNHIKQNKQRLSEISSKSCE